MPTLNINGQRVTVGDEFLQLSPEQQNATVDEIAKGLAPKAPEGFMANAMDAIRSIPRGLAQGASGKAPGNPFVPLEDVNLETAPTRAGSSQTLINQTYAPQGPYGEIGAATGRALADPISFLGPGGYGLKVAGAVLSGGGGEAGAQGVKALGGGQGAQELARLGFGVAGGMAAGKAFGPGMPKAATPTLEELRAAKNADYKVARESGVEFDGHGVGQWASQVKRELAGDFTADAKTGAAGTFGVLSDLHPPAADPMRALTRVEQNPLVTSIALDEVRKKLGRIARDTQDGKPTADAAAATIALKRYYEYLENPPPGHVVAGDAAAYVDTIRRANAGNAAYQRTRDFDSRITNAEDIAARQIAGSEEATIKNKSGALLAKAKQGGTGLNQSEIAQLQLLNSGGPASNTLRQLGRFGAGVVPIGAQAAVAVGTGGTHLVPQAALAAALYAARKGSEAITKSRANKLAEALAQRSPLYEQRKAGLAAPDYTPNTAAILRALLAR